MDDASFIAEVARRLGCDARRAEAVSFVVFQELRARLTPREADDVAAQLPSALKRLWLEPERPNRRVARTHREEFVRHVRGWAGFPDDATAEQSIRAVFAALQHLLGSPTGLEGEAWDVFSQLPKDLKTLWVEASRSGSAGA
jgi:uncharacterized protein (DUF2267 family)